MMRSFLKHILIVGVTLLAVAGGGFVAWAETPPPPQPEAVAALGSTPTVQVQTEPWLVFQPSNSSPETGFILYPGGRVDPRAYATNARAIAEQGYLVVIVPMPLNLAVIAPGRAREVIESFPSIQQWVIGGHSLGGAMAANYAASHPEEVEGLVLWAAYPQASDTLAREDIDVLVMVGTNDTVINRQRLAAAKDYLPPEAHYVEIEGGNHAQFGRYGAQQGDSPATITENEQQRQVVEATVALLDEVEQEDR